MPTPDGTIYVGQVGLDLITQFRDQRGNVIALASGVPMFVLLRRPGGASGALLTCSGTLYTNGLDGKVRYRTVSGDLSVAGNYRAQGYAEPQSGHAFHGTALTFTVDNNLRSG
jgi:hypothetical protein